MLRRIICASIAVALAAACASSDDPEVAERSATATTATTTTAPPTPTMVDAQPPSGGLTAPEPAAGPDELAERLVLAERTSRDPAAAEPQAAEAAFEAQVLYRQLARTPGWHDPVYAAVGDLRPTVEANVAARGEFRGMHATLSDTLPAWRIVEPAAAEDLLAFYRQGEAEFGVPWNILAAINLVETGMGRIRGTSVAGAQGPMQFMPATWEAYGEGDVDDPHDAIMAAARYLAANGGGSGNIDNALYRYNNSHRYVRGVKQYASIMADDARAFYGFYRWQVVYLSTAGEVWLPVGYEQTERVPAADYVAAHPGHHLGTATD